MIKRKKQPQLRIKRLNVFLSNVKFLTTVCLALLLLSFFAVEFHKRFLIIKEIKLNNTGSMDVDDLLLDLPIKEGDSFLRLFVANFNNFKEKYPYIKGIKKKFNFNTLVLDFELREALFYIRKEGELFFVDENGVMFKGACETDKLPEVYFEHEEDMKKACVFVSSLKKAGIDGVSDIYFNNPEEIGFKLGNVDVIFGGMNKITDKLNLLLKILNMPTDRKFSYIDLSLYNSGRVILK